MLRVVTAGYAVTRGYPKMRKTASGAFMMRYVSKIFTSSTVAVVESSEGCRAAAIAAEILAFPANTNEGGTM